MTPVCPECGGSWLYALTFKHSTDCSLSNSDDGRKDADHQRGRGYRDATPTEVLFIEAIGHDLADSYEIRYVHGGVHLRSVYIDGRPAYRPATDRDVQLLKLYEPITEGETYVIHKSPERIRVCVVGVNGTRRAARILPDA